MSKETKRKLPGVFSQRSQAGLANSSRMNWDKMCEMLSRRKAIETQCLGFLLETVHVGAST